MTHRNFVAADHHFGHRNIIVFENGGKKIRPFSSIEEHDETIVERHNNIVRDMDRVYFLGDVAINKSALSIIARMKGRKVLVKGNHDIFKLKDYLPYFEDIRACVVKPDKYILTHIPIHPDCIGRFALNIHGHLHANFIDVGMVGWRNERYKNVCMENIDYTPVDLEAILTPPA